MNDNGLGNLREFLRDTQCQLQGLQGRLGDIERMLELALVGEAAQRMRADALQVQVDRLKRIAAEADYLKQIAVQVPLFSATEQRYRADRERLWPEKSAYFKQVTGKDAPPLPLNVDPSRVRPCMSAFGWVWGH